MDVRYTPGTSDGHASFPAEAARNPLPRNNIPQVTNLTSEDNNDYMPTYPYMTPSEVSWLDGNSEDDATERHETNDGHNDEDVRSAELASLQEIVGWQRGEMEAMKRAIEDMQGLLARQRRQERDLSWQLREHRSVSHGRAALVRDWKEHALSICAEYRSTIRRQAEEISLLKAEIAKGNGQDQVKRRESAPPEEHGRSYVHRFKL
ncbi:hypothetical protein PspLS_06256 [Pyricularia sp. CBS 133598]|nr:hypothetical protein PspLS_06256 [Pyricularia sp. CBS 133598]